MIVAVVVVLLVFAERISLNDLFVVVVVVVVLEVQEVEEEVVVADAVADNNIEDAEELLFEIADRRTMEDVGSVDRDIVDVPLELVVVVVVDSSLVGFVKAVMWIEMMDNSDRLSRTLAMNR